MVAAVVDEIRLQAEFRDGEWTVTGQAASEQGIDLSDIIEELGRSLGFAAPELPAVRVDKAYVEHGAKGTSIGTELSLSEALAIDLSELPLIGDHGGEIRLERLGVALVRDGRNDWGVRLSGDLVVAGEPHELAVPIAAPTAAPPEPRALLPKRRTYGPLTIDSLVVDFHDGALRVRVNARLGRAGLAADVIGLRASVPLDDLRSPRFGIDGLAVTYDVPPLAISGGLLIVPDSDPKQFDGSLSVRAGEYGLTAIGSYAGSKPPSLFAFLQVLVPIGGPPYFYVKGVAGGFGVNRELRLPPVEELEAFPLIMGSRGREPFDPDSTVGAAIAQIQPYMSPLDGRTWVAGGVVVASFGILETQALLTLSFGGRVEIGVLGLSTLEFPPVGREVVRARMALRTVISPSVGELSVMAQLTSDSYVLAPDCRLTGAFAFCFWFKPHPQAGDFVISLGGYHPAFEAPSHYPGVARLGVAWAPQGIPLKLKGTQYFALTPGVAMTGGLLDANWDEGPVRARFNIQADFLVRWAPFHYELKTGVTFAVDATLGGLTSHTLSINVGAELHLWGPDFSGKAHIDLGVMGVTIAFGSERAEPPPLEWKEFQERLLGERETLLRVRVRNGLLAETQDGKYVVDAERFEAATETAVPAKQVRLNGEAKGIEPQRDFGIAPMELAPGELESAHEVRVEKWVEGNSWRAYDELAPEAVTGRAPKALWQEQADLRAALDGDGTVDGLLTGVRLKPESATGDRTRPVRLDTLEHQEEDGGRWEWDATRARLPAPERAGEDARAVLTATIDDPAVAARRAAIVEATLGKDCTIDVAALAERDRLRLRAAPALAAVTEA